MRRKIPSLQALSCFDAAARHESYTRAADELAMTQGAVSRQIAALEVFLGLTLFQRTRHGVRLTTAGDHYARQVAVRLDALERDTLDTMAHQGSGGALHLACVPTFATRWLMPRLPHLIARHADLLLHIDTRTRPFLFADSPFDAAIFAVTDDQLAQWPGTQATVLLQEDLVAVCSPRWLGRRKQLKPQGMAALPLLQQSTRPDAWRVWFDAQGVDAPGAMAGPRYELFSMLCIAATQGLGLALIPRMLIVDELASGALVEACTASHAAALKPRQYVLIAPDPPRNALAVHQLRAWLLDEVQYRPADPKGLSAPSGGSERSERAGFISEHRIAMR